MKAAVCTQYGPPGVVRIAEVAPPRPARNQALIRVVAASVNPLDVALFCGKPRIVRMATGLRTPRTTRPGVDFAGVVEAVGPDVRRACVGDEVFGLCLTDPHARGPRAWQHQLGAFAELLCAPDSAFAPKPPGLSFEEAAAIPVAGLTALQGLRDKGRIETGQSVLINGAAGGVGTLAVGIARALGAEVTGVCRTANVEFVRALGAHHVVDYTREDITRPAAPEREDRLTGQPRRYDLILDCVGNHSFADWKRILTPRGRCVLAGQRTDAGLPTIASRLVSGLLLSLVSTEKLVPFLARPSRRDLLTLADLIEAGQLSPAIDRCYALGELPHALQYLEGKHAQGKVVIRMDPPAAAR